MSLSGRGFTLIECLIGLALTFLVILACLEFSLSAERHYAGLKEKEEAALGALAALDKMKVDILRAGQGLARASALGLVEPIAEDSGGLVVTRAEKALALAADAGPGDVSLSLASVTDLRAGREICLTDGEKGEVAVISAVTAGTAVLASPLAAAYSKDATAVVLLDRVTLALDAGQGVLRRKVNLGTAQPLLENVAAADFSLDRTANLARVRFGLRSNPDAIHEICLFPKNPALAAGT